MLRISESAKRISQSYLRSKLLLFRQPDHEHTAAFRVILYGDFTVVGGYDLMGDGQAQPEVAFGAPGFFRPIEAVENMAFILGGYADAGICHCDLETGPAILMIGQLQFDFPVFGSVADRIV